MRLSDEEISAIKLAIREYFGPDARVYLFGSRTDDRARGGDIDLYVESGLEGEELVEAKLRALSQIQLRIGEQKIDMVTSRAEAGNETVDIVKKARETGVQL